MSPWQENRTKILGTAATVVAGTLSMISLGMFGSNGTEPALLEPVTIRWMTVVLSLLNMVLAGGTVAVGFSNTTAERIASAAARVEVAKADTAAAMETALLSPSPVAPTAPPASP